MDFSSSFFNYPTGGDNVAVQQTVFLPNATAQDWEQLLLTGRRRAFREGEVVIRAGDCDRDFYIVASGRLSVNITDARGGLREIATIENHSIFGEQAFFDGMARSATLTALSAGEIYGISPDAFELLSLRHPELGRQVLAELGRILSLRLREMTALALRGRA